MPSLSLRNIPNEMHLALRARAIQNNRSMEAELRSILKEALIPKENIKLGSLLYNIVQDSEIEEDIAEIISLQRKGSFSRAVDFE